MKKILSGLALSITSIAFASSVFANQPAEVKQPQGKPTTAAVQQNNPSKATKDAKGQHKPQAAKDAKGQHKPQSPKEVHTPDHAMPAKH